MRLPTGHVVPEGSIAMTNIKKFLSDPELWDQPEQFKPERCYFSIQSRFDAFKRFLDKEGKFSRPEHFVPLGHGKRVCMGEPLVKAELFIFFVALVQKIRCIKQATYVAT